MKNQFQHSHKKRKDSLEGSLGRVLFAAELEFPKILVSRLPQNTSNVNIESPGKSKQVYTARFLKHVWPFYNIMHERVKALIHLLFIVLVLIYF